MLDRYLDSREDRERCEAGEERYEGCGGEGLSTGGDDSERIEDRAAALRYTPGEDDAPAIEDDAPAIEDDAPAIEDSSPRAERVVPIRSSGRIVDRYHEEVTEA